jgi:hypothetical protein
MITLITSTWIPMAWTITRTTCTWTRMAYDHSPGLYVKSHGLKDHSLDGLYMNSRGLNDHSNGLYVSYHGLNDHSHCVVNREKCVCSVQCCGSMTFWGGSGSGSADPWLWLMDLDPNPDPGPGSCYCCHWPSRCQQKTNFLTQFFLLITF